MAPTTIRKAIGAVKDQTSISLAKVAGNIAPDLEVLVVKATTHEDDPADEKYVREIMSLMTYSRNYVAACVATVSKRLSKTRDWIVALKTLMLVHRLMADAHFEEEILYSTRRGMRVLNMAGFRDEAHSNSWDHAGFVRVYALYLDEKVELEVFGGTSTGRERRFEEDRRGYRDSGDDYDWRSRSYGDGGEASSAVREKITPVREMGPEWVLNRLEKLLRGLDRTLTCRPTGFAKNSRLVLIALYQVVRESFGLYTQVCEALSVLFDRFMEMEHRDCLKGFDAYVSAAKMIDELTGFYNWCKDMGVARSSEYPQVQRVSDEVLATLERLVKESRNRARSPERIKEDKKPAEAEVNMNEIKALPPPENLPDNDTPAPPPPAPQSVAEPPKPPRSTEDLVNLRDNADSADEQGNKLALALFSGPATVKPEGSWEAFPSDDDAETSAWKTTAAEAGNPNWELVLAESASNLSKQKNTLGGGLDPLLLNGMYDQGTINQHTSAAQLGSGSASSVALPGSAGKSALLALPAPDGTMQPVGPQDPFQASLSVPPPSYVQIADMERKQNLLVQEQRVWEQYAREGMHGQVGLAKVHGSTGYYTPMTHQQTMMPYGMTPNYGYYYPQY